MKLILITWLITFSLFSKGQVTTNDSIRVWLARGNELLRASSFDEAAAELTKIIQVDSSFFKIYLLRGAVYLAASATSVSDFNGKVIHDGHDSLRATKGIMDYRKGIQLFFMDPKEFPEEIVGYDMEYKRPSNYRLGDMPIDIVSEGVLIYITSKGKKKKLSCELWEKAKDESVGNVELLINEFCK